ncbi:MAG: hypothetical protein A2133_12245 [Actinobacteria bacterium RBG_16_64_13]|nr:MAG: hypothetical protein A2133_12245 [Actinobacteria bacterium RBG_16_64_13]
MITVALLLLMLTLVVGACSAGFSLSCGGDEGVKTYTDADYGYSIEYPGAWELQKGSNVDVTSGLTATNSVSVFDPDGASSGGSYIDLCEVSVYELSVTVDDSMMPDIEPQVEAVLADLASQDPSWETVEALSDTSVGGLTGFKTTVSYLMDDTPTTATLYFLFNGSIQYELMLQAATEEWDAQQTSFHAILVSFKPGRATAAGSSQ